MFQNTTPLCGFIPYGPFLLLSCPILHLCIAVLLNLTPSMVVLPSVTPLYSYILTMSVPLHGLVTTVLCACAAVYFGDVTSVPAMLYDVPPSPPVQSSPCRCLTVQAGGCVRGITATYVASWPASCARSAQTPSAPSTTTASSPSSMGS